MKVLVAGCGYVGTELARRLVREGHEVWGLRRTPNALPEGVRPISADLTLPELPGPAGPTRLPAVDSVVFAAAPDASTPDGYRAVYLDGVRNLIAALPGARDTRVLFVSSTAVWGDTGGQWVDEETPTSPEDFRGETLLLAEETALGAAGEAGARAGAKADGGGASSVTILRLGGIYGPGRDRLIRRVRSGEAECPEGPSWSNRIHRDDAAGAILHLLTLPRPERVYLGVDDEPAQLCDVYRHVAALLGVPPPRAAGAISASGTVGAKSAGGERSNKRCSNARLRATGYRFLFPSYREGYGGMLSGLDRGRHG